MNFDVTYSLVPGHAHFSERVLRRHLRSFHLGELVEVRKLGSRAVSPQFAVSTTKGRFVLRILQRHSATDARFEEALLVHLGSQGLMVPRMVQAGRRGRVIPVGPRQYVSVFEAVPGRELAIFEVREEHARQVGTFLAGMHLAGRDLGRQRRNRFDPPRLRRALERGRKESLATQILADLDIIELELDRLEWARNWPRGPIHGELFLRQTRFYRGRLCGVLGFENAATGPFAYDVAAALCDWAFLHDQFQPETARELLVGYQALRPLRGVERRALLGLCRYAAARFALTNLLHFELGQEPSPAGEYQDYRHFMRRLASLQTVEPAAFRDSVLGRVVKATSHGP